MILKSGKSDISAMLAIVWKGLSIPVPRNSLGKLRLFQDHPELLASDSYELRSKVNMGILNTFFKRVYDEQAVVQVTEANFSGLWALCRELGFSGFDADLKAYEASAEDPSNRDIRALKMRVETHEAVLGEHESRLDELERKLAELLAKSLSAGVAGESPRKDEAGAAQEVSSPKVLDELKETIDQKVDKNELKVVADAVERLKERERKLAEELRGHERSGPVTPRKDRDSPVKGDGFFEWDSDEWIITLMSEKCGGNPHLKGIIEITASSDPNNNVYKLVDYGWGSHWSSNNEPDSFVKFDFKEQRVCVHGYSLKSDGKIWNLLLSWVLEASDDGETWDIIDERNSGEDCGFWIPNTMECNKPSDKYYRYVRLRQTGKNSNGSDYLCISEIELFGYTQSP